MQATRALHAGVRRVMRFHSHAQARFVPRGARAMHGSDNTKDRLSLPWMEDDHTMRQPGLAQSDTFAETLLKLSTTFTNHFPTRLSGPRTVGRETEYPIVFDDGRAGDVRKVLHALDAEGDLRLKHEGDVGLYCADYEYSMEVGHGSIEVITGPCETLHELRDLHEDATLRMAAAAQRIGFRVLGLGTQPITAPSRALMSPRRRYIAMLDTALPDEDWLLFTVRCRARAPLRRALCRRCAPAAPSPASQSFATLSLQITHADQCHVDVCADVSRLPSQRAAPQRLTPKAAARRS